MIINSVIGGIGFDVVRVGSGPIDCGYFMDEACAVPATAELIVAQSSTYVRLYHKLLEPVAWADGTDAEIKAMVAAADAGEIDLLDYWSVGDTRTVSLSAMAATGVGESHVAQAVKIVLMHENWTDANGVVHPFLWGLEDGLEEKGYINSSDTNSGGWNSCARRAWCNGVFFDSLPDWLREATGTTAVKTADGSGSLTTISSDRCFLPSEYEVFGASKYANSTAESGMTQVEYYKTSANRIKKCGPSGSAGGWWERSTYSGGSASFCAVTSSGSADYYSASYTCLLAPHGCIL